MQQTKRILLLYMIGVLALNTIYGLTAQVAVEDAMVLRDSAEKSDVLMEYDKLIGSCTCKSLLRDQQGQWKDTINLKWEWSYIMEGKGVQDEGWYISNNKKHHFTSIRVYDTVNKHWYVSYFTPGLNKTPETWTGGKQENDIVLRKKQQTPQGVIQSVLRFSNITPKGFNWEGKIVDKKKNIDYSFWKIWCKKEE